MTLGYMFDVLNAAECLRLSSHGRSLEINAEAKRAAEHKILS